MNAGDYLILPWTISGPARVTDKHGNTHFEMRVRELPDFLVVATSESEALYEFRSALLAFLDSYASEGEVPPISDGNSASFAWSPLSRIQPHGCRCPRHLHTR